VTFVEYGKQSNDVILLLHGGGLSWWNYRDVAELLSSDFRVILPILDGHSGSDSDFTSIEKNAEEIIALIDEKFGGTVLLMGGLSLGGQILLEILSRRSNICRFAIIESALVIPSKLTHSMIAPAFGSCYGLIKYRWFSKLQFDSYCLKPELFENYYKDTCGISKKNMISFLQANALYSLKPSLSECKASAYLIVGERENNAILRSASMIKEKIKSSEIKIIPKAYHGQFSINTPWDYANTVREITGIRQER
jgi:pimeloyl-ACP methyl ester carboxylesterase